MRKEPLKAGDIVEWEVANYNPKPLFPINGSGRIVRKLDPEKETYPFEVEVILPTSHARQRFCFCGPELYRSFRDA